MCESLPENASLHDYNCDFTTTHNTTIVKKLFITSINVFLFILYNVHIKVNKITSQGYEVTVPFIRVKRVVRPVSNEIRAVSNEARDISKRGSCFVKRGSYCVKRGWFSVKRGSCSIKRGSCSSKLWLF